MFVITSEKLDGQSIYTLTAEKTNEGERGAYVRYKFDDWYFVPVDEDSYDAMKETAGRSKTSDEIDDAEEALMELLDSHGELQYKDLQKTMKDRGHDKGVLNFALQSAVAGERVTLEERYCPSAHKKVKYYRLSAI